MHEDCYVHRSGASHALDFARVLPDLVAQLPDRVGAAAVIGRLIGITSTETMTMRPDTQLDPNAELQTFEPLRVVLALGALLLGLLMSLP
jgi:hypothetical protein